MKTEKIKPGLMVHAQGEGSHEGVPGVHVGTVDRLEEDYVKLKKSDTDDGKHHWFPVEWVEKADEKAVYVSKTPEDFKAEILSENPAAA